MITRTIAGREPRPPRENGRAQRRRWADEVRKNFVRRPAALQLPVNNGQPKETDADGAVRRVLARAYGARLLTGQPAIGWTRSRRSFIPLPFLPASTTTKRAARRSGRLASSILTKVLTMKMFPLALFCPLHSTQYLRRCTPQPPETQSWFTGNDALNDHISYRVSMLSTLIVMVAVQLSVPGLHPAESPEYCLAFSSVQHFDRVVATKANPKKEIR